MGLLDFANRTKAIHYLGNGFDAEWHCRIPDWTVMNTRPLRYKVEDVVAVLSAFWTTKIIQHITTDHQHGRTIVLTHYLHHILGLMTLSCESAE